MALRDRIKKYLERKAGPKTKEVRSSFIHFIRDYFAFNRQERNGVVALCCLIILFTAATFALRFYKSTTVNDNAELKKEVDEFLATAVVKYDSTATEKTITGETSPASKTGEQLFSFNPNSATENDFIRLGLSQKQTATIINYRNKGGIFRKKEDFAKIYSISAEEYKKLEAYILIPKESLQVDLNSADSLELLKVRGIGPYTAMKIIENREKLGGFYSTEQLKEIYRVDAERFAEIAPYVRVDLKKLKKLNINTASAEELKKHPYISAALAKWVIKNRKEHGSFKNIEEIKKSDLVNEDLYRKIAPYLTTDTSP